MTRVPPVPAACGPVFKARGAAQYLGLTESRVRRLIASGDLPAVRNVNGRLDGVYQTDCDGWIERHRTRVPAAPPPAPPVREDIDAIVARLPGAGHFA